MSAVDFTFLLHLFQKMKKVLLHDSNKLNPLNVINLSENGIYFFLYLYIV